MNYKLLTFCEDWADEHNVPAVACMTEEEYNVWLKSPSGKLNPNYGKEYQEYQQKVSDFDNFTEELKKRNLNTKPPKDFTEEEKLWYNENKKPYVSWYNKPTRVYSGLRAYLGNSGEGFEDDYEDLYLMEEFVQEDIVKVFDVNEDFYNTFHKAKLSQLSLCNIFVNLELDEYE